MFYILTSFEKKLALTIRTYVGAECGIVSERRKYKVPEIFIFVLACELQLTFVHDYLRIFDGRTNQVGKEREENSGDYYSRSFLTIRRVCVQHIAGRA